MNELSYERLSEQAVLQQMASVPGWSRSAGNLHREFEFDSYSSGVIFANAVAYLADQLNHHPDLTLGYKKVTISLSTHDAGGGLTLYDFELARQVNQLQRR